MIKDAQQVAVPENTAAPAPAGAEPARTLRRPRGSRCRLFARRLKPRRRSRRQAKTDALRRPTSKFRWVASTAATEAYNNSPTPNVILIETDASANDILSGLDRLAEVCDAGTRVIVMGRVNDVTFYRDLTSPRRERIPDLSDRHARCRARDLQPVFGAGCKARWSNCRHRRCQGRCRCINRCA